MDLDELLPAAWCARKVKVSRQLFHYWAKRGLITPAGTAPDGRPLYRVADALAVERHTRASGRSSRAKMTDAKRAAVYAELRRMGYAS